jgi:hypothetical protein
MGDPFQPPDWDRAHDDGTFGNRFDDPSLENDVPADRRFRAIYCATQRIATFGETLARFRPSLNLLTKLGEIDDEESLLESLHGVIDPHDHSRGLIPADWRLRRRIGHTIVDPEFRFVDVAHVESLQHLRTALAKPSQIAPLTDFDLSAVTSPQRILTQRCARYIYDQIDPEGAPAFAGIRYVSRLDSQWECWAFFSDRFSHSPEMPTSLFPDDEDLHEIARIFHLTIEVISGGEHLIRP